jgi:hypothetical protein
MAPTEMMKALRVGAALGLTVRPKRISPAGFGTRRGSLADIPSGPPGQQNGLGMLAAISNIGWDL